MLADRRIGLSSITAYLYGVIAAILILLTAQPASAQVAPVSTAAVLGYVEDAVGKPVAGALITLNGPQKYTQKTDAKGEFFFLNVQFGIYRVTAQSSELGEAVRDHVIIEGDTSIGIAYEKTLAGGLGVIASVATSAGAHFNISAASVASIDPTAAAFEGQTSWRHIVEQIPGVTIAGYDGGYSVYSGGVTGNPFVPLTISVNGALPYETATLLDGMPLIGIGAYEQDAGYGTDLGFYPLNGFGGADVVRGPGASSPSIVDSIGGSFVLRPPSEVRTDHYEFSVSNDPYGGIVSNAQAAVRLNKLSVTATYGVNDSPGSLNTSTPFLVSSPSTVNGGAFTCTGACEEKVTYNPNYQQCYCDYRISSGLVACCTPVNSAWSDHSGSIAIAYDLSPSVSASVFYAGQQQSSTLGIAGQYVYDFTPPDGYTGSLAAGQQAYFSGGGGTGFGSGLYPYDRFSRLVEEKISGNLAHGYFRVAMLQNVTSSAIDYSFPKSNTLQLFGSGSVNGTPTTFNGGTYDVNFASYGSQVISSQGNNRDILGSYTLPISDYFRAGASYVESYYDSPNALYVNMNTYSFSDVQSADQFEKTGETRVWIGANPAKRVTTDISDYFVNADYHVQNPATTTTQYLDQRFSFTAPRLGTVWRPNENTSVRGALGGGIALAPLNYLIGSNAIPYCSAGTCSETLTNTNLQPEKSFGLDVGADQRLSNGVVLSFDLYRTNLYGQAFSSTNYTGTYQGQPLYTTQYQNLGQSRYEGLIFDAKHDVNRGIYWHVGLGMTRAYVVSVPAGFYNTGTCTMCQNLAIVPGINFTAPVGGGFGANVPYSQGYGTIGYKWKPEEFVELEPSYYGPNNSYYRPAFMAFNGLASIPIAKHVTALVNFQNISGIYDAPYGTKFVAENTIGAPSAAGLPFPLFGTEYGVRAIVFTLNFK